MATSGSGGPVQPSGPSNLQLRVISGVVLAIIVLSVTWVGGLAFRMFAAIMALAIVYEWLTITAGRDWTRRHWMVAGLLGVVMLMLVANLSPAIVLAGLLVGASLVFVEASFGQRAYWPPSGLLYAGLGAIALAMLRGGDTAGLWALLFLFATVWITDIAAYFVGRAIGGAKLAPRISPGKTWSGAVGGAIGGAIGGLLVAMFADRVVGLPVFVLMALVLSIVSQCGDLFESYLKRRFAVKDSSNLIPGHGGVMDRVDSLVAAAVAFYVMGAVLAGPGSPAHAFFAAG